jgi:ABC-type transport system involved in cytochrome c biogenesis permease subunit
MNPNSRYLPWIVVALGTIFLVGEMAPDRQGRMHLDEFGSLPVVDGGRVKPFDTVARNSLMVISNRQTFKDEADNTQPAVKWLLDVMTNEQSSKRRAEKYKTFRIDNEQVLNLVGLEGRSGLRYSIEEFGAKIPALEKQATRAGKLDPKQRDLFDQKLVELAQHLELYIKLAKGQVPLAVPPEEEGDDWKSYAEIDAQARQTALMRIKAEADRSGMDVSKLTREQQEQLLTKFHAEYEQARVQISPAAQALNEILRYYADGQADEFNKAVADYRQRYLTHVPSDTTAKANFELFFNRFAPFYQCSVLYVLVFLLACFAWVAWTEPLNRAAFWLTVLTLVVHTWALCARMYIQGRPPVTNLYSSAVFIGWGSVILGLVLEAIYRNGIGNLLSAVTGSLTLLIAHNLASGGDTLEMMQAVLDTNFWLATHVTCVTTGYAATFVAGFLGILFVLRGVFTTSLDKETFQTLGRMIYGIVCFATFFSFTGTVLGGIWADQSWGRFWGWDPKENGALIIVLWNALILHARWGGMVQQRGMAVLAIFGNIVTAWSWFGVNMLGVGLHSYGFMEGAVFWLSTFIVSQLILVGVGMQPLRSWRSFAAQKQEPRPPERKPRGRRDAPVGAASH